MQKKIELLETTVDIHAKISVIIKKYIKAVSISDEDWETLKQLEQQLASLPKEQSEREGNLKCSNCGKVIADCDASCYYKDDEPPKHPTSWRDFTMTDKEPKVGVKERQSAEEYLCNKYNIDFISPDLKWTKKLFLPAMQEYAEQYHKEQTREELKDLQHHKDTTVGLWAFDCNPKELLNKFNDSQSDAHSIECGEFDQLIKDWEDFCDNHNFNSSPFFQITQ